MDLVLSVEELEKVEKLRRELGSVFCRRCGYCAPCTVGIDIPNNFVFHGYLSDKPFYQEQLVKRFQEALA